MGEHPLALVERGQPERRRVGPEVAHRMRVEGRDDHRPPLVRAALHRAPDHRLVAEVEAVEIAQRDDRAAKLLRDRLVVEQALHQIGQRISWIEFQVQTLDSMCPDT